MASQVNSRAKVSIALLLTISLSSSYEVAMASQLKSQLKPLVQTAPNAANPGLPNTKATPGAIDPAVTQNNLSSTICVAGYTKTVRPPVSYTNALKRKQLASGYNYVGDLSTKNYEEDHLIPLELGGAPSDVRNLWPEPRHVTWDAAKKDRLENKLHLLVCSQQLSLKSAQSAFALNWVIAYKKYISSN